MKDFSFVLYAADRISAAEVADAARRAVVTERFKKAVDGVVHHYPLASWALLCSPTNPIKQIGMIERLHLEREDHFIGPDGEDLAQALARQLGPHGVRVAALTFADGHGECKVFQSLGTAAYAEFTAEDQSHVDKVLSTFLSAIPTTLGEVVAWCQRTSQANPYAARPHKSELADEYHLFLLTHGHALSSLGVRLRDVPAALTTEEWAALVRAAHAAHREQHQEPMAVGHA